METLTGGLDVQTMAGMNAMLRAQGSLFMVVIIGLLVLYAVSMWKIYQKAGYKGYEALINGHNTFLYITMAKRPGWYFFLLLVPYVLFLVLGGIGEMSMMPIVSAIGVALMIVGYLIMYVDLSWRFATSFGKGKRFRVGLILLPIVFYPILAFGKAKYKK